MPFANRPASTGRRDAATAARTWHVVRGWPGLTAEAKLAWDYLMELTQGAIETIVEVSIGAIGEKQGAGDASRSGRRNLERLRDVGLLDVRDKSAGGRWLLYLHDPLEVRRARLLAGDPQRGLFDEAAEPGEGGGSDPAADDIQTAVPGGPGATNAEISAALAPRTPAPGNTPTPTSNLETCARAFTLQRPAAGGSGARAAENDRQNDGGPEPVTASLGYVQARVEATIKARPAEAARLVKRIQTVVADPNLAVAICERIAWEVVEGGYPQHKLEAILRRVETRFHGRSAKDRGSYFIRAMDDSFREAGLQLFARRAQPPTPPDGGSA